MGNVSYSVSGFGAGDASRKSVRGSARSCKRQRTSSSCCHFVDNNWLLGVIGDQYMAKVARRKKGQVTKNTEVTNLEELLVDSAALYADLDASSDCVSPFSVVESMDDSGEGSGYFSDEYQLVASLRDEEENDGEDNDVMAMCDEDKAMMMMMKTSTTICGEEWINWTALCPCCRRDASDDSIDLQEMIKLEPIRVVSAEMYERQIFGPGGKIVKCLGCFHMGVVVTLEHPCRKGTETRYLIHKLRDFDDATEGVLTVVRMSAVNVGKVWHSVPETKKTVQRSTFLDFKNACGNEYRFFGNNCVHSVKRMMELP